MFSWRRQALPSSDTRADSAPCNVSGGHETSELGIILVEPQCPLRACHGDGAGGDDSVPLDSSFRPRMLEPLCKHLLVIAHIRLKSFSQISGIILSKIYL